MSRKKNPVPSQRIRLDGFQEMPVTDLRVQVALDWYEKNKSKRKAFPMAWGLLIAALNGELGANVQQAVEAGAANTEEALEALQDLMGVTLS